jgi:hypothetical protein
MSQYCVQHAGTTAKYQPKISPSAGRTNALASDMTRKAPRCDGRAYIRILLPLRKETHARQYCTTEEIERRDHARCYAAEPEKRTRESRWLTARAKKTHSPSGPRAGPHLRARRGAWALPELTPDHKRATQRSMLHIHITTNTTSVSDSTPYEDGAPNVSEITRRTCMGNFKGPEMLPKPERRAYVGYDDGSSSVEFHSAQPQKTQLQRLQIPDPAREPHYTPSEEIEVTPDPTREGEPEGGTRRMGEKFTRTRG